MIVYLPIVNQPRGKFDVCGKAGSIGKSCQIPQIDTVFMSKSMGTYPDYPDIHDVAGIPDIVEGQVISIHSF